MFFLTLASSLLNSYPFSLRGSLVSLNPCLTFGDIPLPRNPYILFHDLTPLNLSLNLGDLPITRGSSPAWFFHLPSTPLPFLLFPLSPCT